MHNMQVSECNEVGKAALEDLETVIGYYDE